VSETLTIPRRFRVALAGKAGLLLALCLVFVALTAGVLFRENLHWAFKIPLGGFFALTTWFLGWTTWLASADVIFGKAIKVSGAQALPSRKSGISFRLTDGGTAEYLLVNQWKPTELNRKYGLTIGRFSHVIIEEPRDEGPAEPLSPDWRKQRAQS
jgi:hypothetical protein